MTDHEQNDLEEAVGIMRGLTRQTPEPRHLRALNDSRIYWREAAMTRRHKPVVPLTPQRERAINRIHAFFNWEDRLSDRQHAAFMVLICLVSFLCVSACFAGALHGVRMVLR